MIQTSLFAQKLRLLATVAPMSLALVASPAFAQATAQNTDPATAATEEEPETVVVTGSRIRQPNTDSPVPITTITGEQIFQTGRVSVGDVLNDLPQLSSSLGSQNSTSGLGVRGLNFLDLRGLGRSRTLTLINGRRQVTADIINTGNAVDINTLPTDLIERVDIVTGGNSSIYGSDAISGVVNFILKDNYDGVSLHAQTGVSKYGDAGNQYISLVAGTNFAEGRGNFAINAEFAHQEDYYAAGRPNLRQNNGFVVVDTDVGASSDSVKDRVFYRDLRGSTISLGGQVGVRYSNTVSPCGKDAVGSSFTCSYLFQPGGDLVSQTGLRVGLGPNGSFLGGNGATSRDGQLVVLSPDLKRYVFNAIGHFEISPAFVPFVEAKYVRTEAFGSQSGPFFSQGQTLGDFTEVPGFTDRSYANSGVNTAFVNREGIRLDNPYLSAGARTTIAQQLTAAINSGINPNTGAAYKTATNTDAQAAANQAAAIAQVAAGTFRFSSRRNWVDLGMRDEQIKRETFRVVAGVRGDFNTDWNYEISANYSQHKENNLITGNVNTQRFLLALDTTRNAQGQIVCRSQVDAAYAGSDIAGNAAQLAKDVAACVPLNPVGQGGVSDAARAYLLAPTRAIGKATQFVASGFVSGNLGQLFQLPGGPISFSVGGEYRRETLSYDLDEQTQLGYNFYNAIPSFSAPSFEVKEAFGEVSIPLVKDVFLLKELTLSGSARVADYKGSVGTVFAYSGDVTWRPINDFLVRASYSKSVRAPYLGDLYSLQGQNFTPAPSDPCSVRNINTGTSTRPANCAAAGIPTNYDFPFTSSLEILSGGNPNLKQEKSTSWTLGGVYQPSFARGLTLSLDYYNITVDDVIASLSVQQALDACYDAPSLDNSFCGLFKRDNAAGDATGTPFRILDGSFLDSPRNYAKLKATGFDANVDFNRDFGFVKASVKGTWNHVIQRDDFTDPSRPNYKDVVTDELGDPSDAFNISTDLKFGKFTIGHTLRWIAGMYLNTWEDYNSVNGLPPQNPDYADIIKYPAVTYNDVRASYDVTEKFNFYGGVSNVGDVKPPYGLTGVTTASGIYDNRGRFFYMGATAKF